MKIFKINDKVNYNKTNFVISAFLDEKNERSFIHVGQEWVLLYQPKTCTQIIAHVSFIQEKEKKKHSSIDTDDILEEVFP